MSNELKPAYEHFYMEDCVCPRCSNHTKWINRLRSEAADARQYDRDMWKTFRLAFLLAFIWMIGVLVFLLSTNAAGDLRQ